MDSPQDCKSVISHQILKPKGFCKILPLKPNKSTIIHTQKLDKYTITWTVHVKTNSIQQMYKKTGCTFAPLPL